MITAVNIAIATVVVACVGIALPAMIIVTLESEWIAYKRRKAEEKAIREAVATNHRGQTHNPTTP